MRAFRFRNLFAVLLIVPLGMLHITSQDVAAEPAIVLWELGPCGMVGADEDGNPIFGGYGETTLVIENESMLVVICHGEDITNLSRRGHSYKIGCSYLTPDGEIIETEDGHWTVSPTGDATGICFFEKP